MSRRRGSRGRPLRPGQHPTPSGLAANPDGSLAPQHLNTHFGQHPNPQGGWSNPGVGYPKPGGTQAGAPYGSYDPQLDQQLAAANTGLGYLKHDTATNLTRATSDLGINETALNNNYQNSLADILTARARGQQDYKTNTGTLNTNYQRLGNQQTQRADAAGLLGGALAQAKAKRAANQGVEQGALDTNFNRFSTDSVNSQKRLDQGAQTDLGQLLSNYNRYVQDQGLNLTRAIDENATYGTDIGQIKTYSAQQNGALYSDGTPVSGYQFGTANPNAGGKHGGSAHPNNKPGKPPRNPHQHHLTATYSYHHRPMQSYYQAGRNGR